MENKIKFSFLLLLSFISFSCEEELCVSNLAPFGLKIIDKDNKNLLFNPYQQHDLRLFYLQNRSQVDVDFELAMTSEGLEFFRSVPLTGLLKRNDHLRTFYLKFKENDIDTIQVEVGKRGDKCTRYVYEKMLYNGQVCPRDNSVTTLVYIANK